MKDRTRPPKETLPKNTQQDILIFKVKLFREKERKRERKYQLTN